MAICRVQFTFNISLSAAYDRPVTMSFRTANGTGKTTDNNYVAKTGTRTSNPGETTETNTIEVKGDSKKVADQIFTSTHSATAASHYSPRAAASARS
jgi:hypothetical protein